MATPAQAPEWVPRERNYVTERAASQAPRERTQDHPLRASGGDGRTDAAARAAAAAAAAVDPLSAMLAADFDPLAMQPAISPADVTATVAKADEDSAMLSSVEAKWREAKRQMLEEFTVSGKIRVTANLIGNGTADSAEPVKVSLDKTRQRLEQLQSRGEEDSMELSQKELLEHVKRLHTELLRSWATGDRVTSLRRAIQCAKLLGDMSVPQFYPAMFAVVSDILDSFGKLVFERLRGRIAETSQLQGDTPFTTADVASLTARDLPAEARETARNWFFKISCVRELLPRLYIEMSILPCYRFLDEEDVRSAMQRICSSIRGIGNPLVAAYARVYLLHVSNRCAQDTALVALVARTCYNDFTSTITEFKRDRMERTLTLCGMDASQYFRLFRPALEWVATYLALGSDHQMYGQVLQHYRDQSGQGVVLKPLLDACPSELAARGALRLVAMVKEADECGCSKADMFCSLGEKLVDCPPAPDQRLPVLNEVWKTVRQLSDLEGYVRCAVIYVRLLSKHYSEREVLILLRDFAKRVAPVKNDPHLLEPLRPHLEAMVQGVVESTTEFGAVLTSEPFLGVMDMFESEKKVQACKKLLETFGRGPGPTADPVVIHSVFDLARHLHDAVDSLSIEDERRQASRLICRFIEKVDFGRDLEQQLNVLVDCRAAFANLDHVNERLVIAVARLAMKAHQYMRGKHTRKTSAFVKACLAYCHITIPSIDDVFKRMTLFLLCAQVALVNQCLPQADTCFKHAIALIQDVPEFVEVDHQRVRTEEQLLAFLRNFTSALVVAPGHPEHGALYLVRGLLNAVQRYSWQPGRGGKARAYIAAIPLLCAYAQRRLPNHVERVESNDVLYGGNPEYRQELLAYLHSVVEDALAEVSLLVAEGGDANFASNGVPVALALLTQLVTHVRPERRAVAVMQQLLQLCAKHCKAAHPQYSELQATLAHLRSMAELGARHPALAGVSPAELSVLVEAYAALARAL